MGVSKNSGTPKWMVYFMENPIKMDFGGQNTPIFWVDTHIDKWVITLTVFLSRMCGYLSNLILNKSHVSNDSKVKKSGEIACNTMNLQHEDFPSFLKNNPSSLGGHLGVVLFFSKKTVVFFPSKKVADWIS